MALVSRLMGLTGSGSVDTQSGGTPTLTVGANGGSGTLTGSINNSSGTLSLTKIGAGTETLSGGYTYSGTTTVKSAGTLGLVTFRPFAVNTRQFDDRQRSNAGGGCFLRKFAAG